MARPADGVVRRTADRLRALWAADRPAFGAWSSSRDPAVAELLAATDFDYVCVDLQHGAATFSELPGIATAMRAADRSPVVRVPWNEPVHVMRAIDVGAAAVMVPYVDGPEDALRAAQACRFPPTGTRSWGPMWGDLRADGALPPEEQDAAVICVVMVETQAGVDALEDIVSIPGVDAVYIGPNDLALGCGYGRRTYRDSPEVDALIQRIVDVCRDAGVVAGVHCSDVDMAVTWAGRGARMLTAAADLSLLRKAADAARREIDAAL